MTELFYKVISTVLSYSRHLQPKLSNRGTVIPIYILVREKFCDGTKENSDDFCNLTIVSTV